MNYLHSKVIFCFLLLSTFVCTVSLYSQNTVGTTVIDSTLQDGYTLFFPEYQANVYLIDPCGQIVHSWLTEKEIGPGFSVYLTEEGNLIKTSRPTATLDSASINGSGSSGFVEILDWDNNVLWSYEQLLGNRRLHHDIEPLPNGNILMVAWEIISLEDAYALGRDPETLTSNELFDEVIFEVDPNTNEIVWEWKASDHLIQTFNTVGPNWVGNPAAWSQRIDLNYVGDSNRKNDWLHINSIDYNEELDQIMVSVPSFGEFWIIDHSTTTIEAAGRTGGKSGKGGDLMYRWGNPEAYNAGDVSDKKLFYQHAPEWISGQLSDPSQRKGEVILFNNRLDNYSSVMTLSLPEFDTVTWNYIMDGSTFGPAEIDREIVHPEAPSEFYSTIMSNGQMLDNGNVLVGATLPGTFVEITPDDKIAWEYVVPTVFGEPLEQGAEASLGGALVFKVEKYPLTFPGFNDRDLAPKGYLELNPNFSFCSYLDTMMVDTMMIDTMMIDTMMVDTMMIDTMMIDSMDVSAIDVALVSDIILHPNPAYDYIQLDWTRSEVPYEIYNLSGKSQVLGRLQRGENKILLQDLVPGIYIIRIGQYGAKRFIKM